MAIVKLSKTFRSYVILDIEIQRGTEIHRSEKNHACNTSRESATFKRRLVGISGLISDWLEYIDFSRTMCVTFHFYLQPSLLFRLTDRPLDSHSDSGECTYALSLCRNTRLSGIPHFTLLKYNILVSTFQTFLNTLSNKNIKNF